MSVVSSESISLVNLRNSLGDVIAEVGYTQRRATVSKNGKPVAAIVSIEDLEMLERLEERADIEALRQAEADDDGTRISWKDFLAGKEL